MTVFFTSDLHFGHERILALEPARGALFGSAAEMDDGLVERWNDVVGDDDTVWVLGDVDMHGRSLSQVARLRGRKALVCGNHDEAWGGFSAGWKARERYLAAGFAAVMDFASVRLPAFGPESAKVRALLSHFPYAGDSQAEDRYVEFRLRDQGVPLLHGHVHGAWRARLSPVGTPQLNVGVDVWDLAPVSEVTVRDELAAMGAWST